MIQTQDNEDTNHKSINKNINKNNKTNSKINQRQDDKFVGEKKKNNKAALIGNQDRIQKAMKKIALMGQLGAGKTLLFNKLTQQPLYQGCSEGTESMLSLKIGTSSGIIAYDTPGMGSYDHQSTHIGLQLYVVLDSINLIACVVKADRYSVMKAQSCKLYDLVENKEAVAIIVTHCDNKKNRGSYENDVTRAFLKEGVNKILCTGLDTPQRALEEFLSESCLNTASRLVYSKCRAIEKLWNKVQYLIKNKKQKQLLDELESVEFEVVSKITSVDKGSDDLRLLDYLTSFHHYINSIKADIVEQDHTDWTYYYYTVVAETYSRVQIVGFSRLSYDASDPNEPNNQVKKCPYCQTVWVKVCGCTGKTICGSRVMEYDNHVSLGRVTNWIGNRISTLKHKILTPNKYKCVRGDAKELKENKWVTHNSAVGCGREFVWRLARTVEPEMLQKYLSNIGCTLFNSEISKPISEKIESDIDKVIYKVNKKLGTNIEEH